MKKALLTKSKKLLTTYLPPAKICWQISIIYGCWWGLLLLLAAIFATDTILPFTPTYASVENVTQSGLPAALARWGGFDGVHYYSIAAHGYQSARGIQAFFPLYPLLVALIGSLLPNYILSGVLLAGCCSLIFLLLTHQYLRQNYSPRLAWWWLAVWLTNPASFFLVSFYTESLFLLLLFLTWLTYKNKAYRWSGFWGMLLTASRVVGVVAVAVLVLAYLYRAYKTQQLFTRQTLVQALYLGSGVLGLLAYCLYLWWQFADPLLFVHVQNDFGAGRQTDSLVLLPQVLWRYGKMFYYGLPLNSKTYAIVQELILSVTGGLILIITGWQNYRDLKPFYPWEWWLFSVGAFMLPTLTGSFSSMPRYLLVCLVIPLFFSRLGNKRPLLGVVGLTLSALLLSVNLLLFIAGLWVA